ncbi:MAG: DUF421 domain-containing protein [Trueperaceae bacterium]|nr:DUF421 domain-containing protein [Trueperaceae bacterium]
MEPLFFDGWNGIARTLVVGTLGYVVLVFMLRIFGNRTLSKMNAFDAIVTIALGSTLATLVLDSAVSLAEGATAFALLIGLQYIVTWSSARMPWVKHLVTGEPKLVAFRGKMLHDAMRRTRVTEDEIRAALRNDGYAGFEDVEAIVLETDGVFSIVGKNATGGRAALKNVQGMPSD